MRFATLLLAVVLVAASGPTRAENDTVVNATSINNNPAALLGLMLNRQPHVADNLDNVEAYATSMWCQELQASTTAEDRTARLKKIQALIKDWARQPSKLQPFWRPFSFGHYNRAKGTISINIGREDWQQSARVGHLIGMFNRKCWPNANAPGSFPQEVYAHPDWTVIPTEFEVTEAEAEKLLSVNPVFGPPRWNQNVLPKAIDYYGHSAAQLTFVMDVMSFTVEQPHHPHVVLRGPTLSWTIRLADSLNNTVRVFSSETYKKATHTPADTSPPLAAAESRVVTSSFNVREQPSINAALISTLGPNAVFDIEHTSPDGEWTHINAATIVSGWANTAVMLRSSATNEPRKD